MRRVPYPVPRGVSLWVVLELALAVRILAADALEWYLRRSRPGQLCLFPDSDIYWQLARCVRRGGPYEIIEWGDIPYFALRTPGYPLFLAAVQAIFGENTLIVRLVQALLGTLCVYMVYVLTKKVAPSLDRGWNRKGLTTALCAGGVVAIHPYFAIMSSLVLSEGLFEPLMLASLVAVAVLWKNDSEQALRRGERPRHWLIAVGGGSAAGAAILVRPSWALFLPIMLGIWLFDSRRDRERLIRSVGYGLLFVIGLSVVMGPWWIRNAKIYERFVPTALWMGASLYDGLNPNATGASDMVFRADQDVWPLDEFDQDRELTRRAVAFAIGNPSRVVELGWNKIVRYWSPWPNADLVRGIGPTVLGAVIEIPLYGLMIAGIWARRRDVCVLTLLAGPMIYFCMLHAVFASSMRYRLPGEIPAVGLAAIGFVSLVTRGGSGDDADR